VRRDLGQRGLPLLPQPVRATARGARAKRRAADRLHEMPELPPAQAELIQRRRPRERLKVSATNSAIPDPSIHAARGSGTVNCRIISLSSCDRMWQWYG